jgi:HNH endonuclease/NUMOD4 motif
VETVNWRTIIDFPSYEVSDEGIVRNKTTRRWVTPAPNHKGYLRVRLVRDGRLYDKRVHLLVLEAFVGPRPTPRHHGAHAPERDLANNRLDNLRWALPEENERDKKAHGTWRTGKHTRFSSAQIARIRASSRSHAEEARRLNVHPHTISRIRRGLRHSMKGRTS